MDPPFPQAVCNLLREHLTTFERVEILLLLHAQPDRPWTVRSVSEASRVPVDLAEEALRGLHASGLVHRDENAVFRFGPDGADRVGAVEALAVLYREQRTSVMAFMSVSAIERIRSGTMRAFADSFIFGKKNRDG